MSKKPSRRRPPLLSAPTLREDPPGYFLGSGSAPDPDRNRDPEQSLEELFRYLRTIESEPTSTLARQLIADGIELPDPRLFTEDTIRDKLWEVIHGLAHRRNFLYSTDHLSDLDLYRYLWEVTLNQPSHELDNRMGDCACHIDLVGDGSDESIWLWLRYYADEPTRLDWIADFPGESIPTPVSPPFDRDRHLPKRFPNPDLPAAESDDPF